MRLLMVSGDRQVAIGERGPFYSMQREFSRYFERIDVICPRPPGEVTIRSIWDNVHFHPATVDRTDMVGYIVRRGGELIDQHQHSLIVSHDYGWFYNGLGSGALSRAHGIPYISEIHHVPGVPVAANMRERFDKWVARAYIRWARRRARAFRVVNESEMPGLLRGWGVPRGKILVLPSLYIDQGVFRPAAERLEAEYDLVFVGRMVMNKGVDRILRSMRILAQEGMPLRGLFVGKGPLLDSMRSLAERLKVEAHFLEWVDRPEDLADLYRRSRVCVCASTCEGGSRFTVEAMACGTPVVSTAVGVMPDLVGDGRAGGLTSFDDHGLAGALRRVLESEELRLAMGDHAVKVAAPFEYERSIGVYANGLRQLVGEEPLAPDERSEA